RDRADPRSVRRDLRDARGARPAAAPRPRVHGPQPDRRTRPGVRRTRDGRRAGRLRRPDRLRGRSSPVAHPLMGDAIRTALRPRRHCQSPLISSNVLPLVSGTFAMMKTRAATPKAAYTKKVWLEPSRAVMTGKEKLTRKLAPQLDAVDTATA